MEHTDSENHRQKHVRTVTAELQGQAVYHDNASLSADSFIVYLHLLYISFLGQVPYQLYLLV